MIHNFCELFFSIAICVSFIFTYLRLYCLRLSDKILILGNGGVKSVDSIILPLKPYHCYPRFLERH